MSAWSLDEHRTYLADAGRLEAFTRALAEIVKPGDVVLDLGCGTGVLGLLALQAGAARVYAVDSSPVLALARTIATANGWSDHITHLRGRSTAVSLPEQVDVVVGDQLDGFVVDAGLHESWFDGWRRHLRPGGVLIPAEVDWWVTPIAAPGVADSVHFWQTTPAGLDTGAVAELAANVRRHERVGPEDVLGSAIGPGHIELAASLPAVLRMTGTSIAARAGRVDALAGWFDARLSPSARLTNDPTADDRIDRRLAVLPLIESVEVSEGDELAIAVDVRTASGAISWRVGDGPRQSTLLGELLTAEDLRARSDDVRLQRTTVGHARHQLLDLSDGSRTRGEIETIVATAHPDINAQERASFFEGDVEPAP